MLGVWLIYILGLSSVVIVPRENLLTQWLATFAKAIPDLVPFIWVVGVNKPPVEGVPAVIITMDTRVSKIPQNYIDIIGTFIIDEADKMCTPSRVESLLAFTPRYSIAETATLERDDTMHRMIQTMVGEHSITEISKDPYTVIQVETGVSVPDKITIRGPDFTDLCKELSNNEVYNSIVVDIVKTNLNRKFIIFTKLADHATKLSLMMIENGISSDTMIRSKKNYIDSTVLVGTMSKIGIGFDEENCCPKFLGRKSDVLIFFHSTKKWQCFEQFRGRVMRSPNPVIVWLNPKNATPKKHLRELRPWIEETNGKLVKVL